MISKQNFINALNNIQTQRKKIEKFEDALETLCDGYVIFDDNNLYLESLLSILQECMDDQEDFISWWLYEDVEKVIYEGDKKIDVSTPEKLYDFIMTKEEN